MDMTVEQLDGGVVKAILTGRLDISGAAEIDMRFSVLAGANKAVIEKGFNDHGITAGTTPVTSKTGGTGKTGKGRRRKS